jgi:hypothetical protein
MLFDYILKVSIGFIAVYLFYLLLLRRLTFYTANRYYFLVLTSVILLLPFIDVAAIFRSTAVANNEVLQVLPSVTNYSGPIVVAQSSQVSVVSIIFLSGVLFFCIRLAIQYISLYRIYNCSKLVVDSPVRVYSVHHPIVPFSFGNAIFINEGESEGDLLEIIRHEFVHVKQKHTVDILWMEFLCIANWFNPFVWLIRKAVRENLEFLADNKMLESGLDKKKYQYLLLKVVGAPGFSVGTSFNLSHLKKRIAMMNKNKTTRIQLVRFLCLLPLIAAVLIAFRRDETKKLENPSMSFVDTSKPKRAAEQGLHGSVKSILLKDNRVLVVTTDDKTEVFDMKKEDQRKAFAKKYGKIPEPPVAPAAPSPKSPATAPAPSPAAEPVEPVAPAAAVAPPAVDLDIAAPPAPPTPVIPAVPKHIKSIHVSAHHAQIEYKNGKIRKFDLRKEADQRAYLKDLGETESQTDGPIVSGHVIESNVVTVSTDEHNSQSSTASEVATMSADEIDVTSGKHPENGSEQVLAQFDKYTAKSGLEAVKEKLKSYGYVLDIPEVNYKGNVLESMRGSVTGNNDEAYFNAHNFEKVMIIGRTSAQGKKSLKVKIIGGSLLLTE